MLPRVQNEIAYNQSKNRKVEREKIREKANKRKMKNFPRNMHFAFKIPLIHVHSVVSCLHSAQFSPLFHFVFIFSFTLFLVCFLLVHEATDKITEIVEIALEALQSAANKYIYCSHEIPRWNKTLATHHHSDELKWNELKRRSFFYRRGKRSLWILWLWCWNKRFIEINAEVAIYIFACRIFVDPVPIIISSSRFVRRNKFFLHPFHFVPANRLMHPNWIFKIFLRKMRDTDTILFIPLRNRGTCWQFNGSFGSCFSICFSPYFQLIWC